MRGETKKEVSGSDGLDLLTEIWNKKAVEIRIDECLRGGGTLFLCDVNNMKQVNSRYGHLPGDECLKQTAKTLSYLIREKDILGRTGGDEFAVFMPGCENEEAALAVKQRILDRFAVSRRKEEKIILPSISIGIAVYQKGDTCGILFQRAGEMLIQEKKRWQMSGSRKAFSGKDDYKKDVRRVKQDLMEQIRKPGAYCRDYETFKSIYRFLERGIIRSRQKASVILMSVVDEEGKSVLPDEKDRLMERLGEDIRTTLRIGDVYTRYTSGQYLVLVIDTTGNQADMIAERIKAKFLTEEGKTGLLMHYCYELMPAKIGEMESEWKGTEQKNCL